MKAYSIKKVLGYRRSTQVKVFVFTDEGVGWELMAISGNMHGAGGLFAEGIRKVCVVIRVAAKRDDAHGRLQLCESGHEGRVVLVQRQARNFGRADVGGASTE